MARKRKPCIRGCKTACNHCQCLYEGCPYCINGFCSKSVIKTGYRCCSYCRLTSKCRRRKLNENKVTQLRKRDATLANLGALNTPKKNKLSHVRVNNVLILNTPSPSVSISTVSVTSLSRIIASNEHEDEVHVEWPTRCLTFDTPSKSAATPAATPAATLAATPVDTFFTEEFSFDFSCIDCNENDDTLLKFTECYSSDENSIDLSVDNSEVRLQYDIMEALAPSPRRTTFYRPKRYRALSPETSEPSVKIPNLSVVWKLH